MTINKDGTPRKRHDKYRSFLSAKVIDEIRLKLEERPIYTSEPKSPVKEHLISETMVGWMYDSTRRIKAEPVFIKRTLKESIILQRDYNMDELDELEKLYSNCENKNTRFHIRRQIFELQNRNKNLDTLLQIHSGR